MKMESEAAKQTPQKKPRAKQKPTGTQSTFHKPAVPKDQRQNRSESQNFLESLPGLLSQVSDFRGDRTVDAKPTENLDRNMLTNGQRAGDELDKLLDAYRSGDEQAGALYCQIVEDNPEFKEIVFSPDGFIRSIHLEQVYRNDLIKKRLLRELSCTREKLVTESFGTEIELILVDQIMNCKALLIREEILHANRSSDHERSSVNTERVMKASQRLLKTVATLSRVQKDLEKRGQIKSLTKQI